MRAHCRAVFLVWAAAALIPSLAQAEEKTTKSTLFVIELQGGLGESAYSGGGPGLAYGISAGTTLKFKSFPVRWYLLGTLLGRNTNVAGRHEGIGFSADRRELDLFAAVRTVVPVWRFMRAYFEVGLGQRIMSQTVRRQENLGNVEESSNELLLVLGLGLQARLTKRFSVGIRSEVTPLNGNTADLASFAADLQSEPNRLTLFAQFGVHF